MFDSNQFLERRVHPRVSLLTPVRYLVIEDQKSNEMAFDPNKSEQTSQTMDISLGGVYLLADHSLKVGSILRLDITLPEISYLISVYAEVVWSNDTGGGLHFEVVLQDDLNVLKKYLPQKSHEK